MGKYRSKGLVHVSSCSAEHFQGRVGVHVHTQAPTCLSLQQLDWAQSCSSLAAAGFGSSQQ